MKNYNKELEVALEATKLAHKIILDIYIKEGFNFTIKEEAEGE